MQASEGNNVNLIPVMNGNQFGKWEMSLNNGSPQGPGSYPHIPIVKGATGSVMNFTILGNPNSNIVFASTVSQPPPGSGPIYIQAGSAKPTSGVNGQFTYTVSSNGKVLTLTDSNQQPGPYTYVLNFVNAGQLDPIIDNGGPSLSHNDYVWYAAGALVLMVVLWLILKRKPSKPGPVE